MTWKFYKWEIPFLQSFKHNSAERDKSATVLACVEHDGIVAWGEACPREYVTGETVESCLTFLTQFKSQLQPHLFESIDDWKKFKEDNLTHFSSNQSALCALEMAVLDYLSKKNAISIEALLGAEYKRGPFYYSAIIGDVTDKVWEWQLEWHRSLGIRDYKLKLNGDPLLDQQRIDAIRALIPAASIRLDANNKWLEAEEVCNYLKHLDRSLVGIEEPLRKGNFDALNALSARMPCALILDEHVCTIEDIAQIALPEKCIVNLRVSKCGGILNTITMAEEAFQKGMQVVIGAQVGESSLLTRAATIVVNAISKKPLAQEGAYGTNLLTTDLTERVLQFGENACMFLDAIDECNGMGKIIWNAPA